MIDHGVLRLTFADGLSGEVDVLDSMRYGFPPVFVDAETGGVGWLAARISDSPFYFHCQSHLLQLLGEAAASMTVTVTKF